MGARGERPATGHGQPRPTGGRRRRPVQRRGRPKLPQHTLFPASPIKCRTPWRAGRRSG